MAPGSDQQLQPKALDRGAVIETLVRTLLNHGSSPPQAASPTEAPPVILKSGADLIMALVHVIMLRFGCRFIGLGEEGPTTSNDDQDDPAAPLPSGWNSTGDTYSFRYRHTQSTFTFLIKGVKVANRLVLHGMAIEDGKLLTLELNSLEYISPSFSFPYRSGSNRPLASGFISEEIIDELITKIRSSIVQKLLPGHGVKLGYEEPQATSSTSASTSNSNNNNNRNTPPSRPDPLRYEPPGSYGYPGRIPGYGIGNRDLDPFAASPGILGPRGGMGIGSPFAGMGGGGGMVFEPDHPMFGRGSGGGGFAPPMGGPDRLGPLAIPPGARFDPIRPFGPGAGPDARPGRGGSGSPFSGEPDNDDLPPSGYNDMFM